MTLPEIIKRLNQVNDDEDWCPDTGNVIDALVEIDRRLTAIEKQMESMR